MIISIVAAAVLAVIFITVRVTYGAKDERGGVTAMFLKALASLGFIAVGVTAVCLGVQNIRAAVFVLSGLVFGLVGDMVLDLKVVYADAPEEELYLTGGMISFGLGHVMYFVALCLFLGKKVISLPLVGVCVAVAVVIVFAMIFGGEKLMKLDFGKFLVHSLLYAFVLVFMSALSVGTCIVLKNSETALFTAGALLFLLSDVVLTSMYFGGRAKDKTLCAVNHGLYYAAQICIAAFIFTM